MTEEKPLHDPPERPYNWHKVERPRQKRSRARIAILVALILILLAVAGILYGEFEINSAQNSSASRFAFIVYPGDTDTSVANRLAAKGYLHDTVLFRIAARLQGVSGDLRPGTYTLRPDMSINDMVKTLASYNPNYRLITILPGYRAQQIAEVLTSDGLDGRQFMHIVRHPHFRRGLPVGLGKHHDLEGFLFPDTYKVDHSASVRQIVVQILEEFNHEFSPSLRHAAKRRHKPIFNVVTMASIVQREDYVPAQKPLIAGVYYNRLHDPAQFPYLQSDPTVQYAMGGPGNWWPIINVAPRSVQSPYNTYIRPGLPPGPICSPDLSSLEAAVRPAHSHYYYFFGKKDGVILFERTLAQHNLDIQHFG